ncbi:MAG: hypothetical protein HJJLKODD_00737 [Phycisphaerae bacterium]|nr:hypothetical protein [Phycisphaerae bacterium]
MNSPPAPSHYSKPDQPAGLPQLPLALVTAVIGIVAGVLLTRVILTIGLLMPVVGFTVGYAINKICTRPTRIIAIIAIVSAFVGTLIAELFIYVLPNGPWDYLLNFYRLGSLYDWIMRVLNPIVAFSFVRDSISLPLAETQGRPCPQCQAINSTIARFCSSCGAALK